MGGCLTKEKREQKQRVGFRILDLMSGIEAELASNKTSLGPKVGRYRVNLSGLRDVGAVALREASVGGADVIVIDEVGPMELTSSDFRRAAEGCISSGKPIVAVVHELMKDPLIEKFREMEDGKRVEVTLHNREGLPEVISTEVFAALAARDGRGTAP